MSTDSTASERINALASELEAEKLADTDPTREMTADENRWAFVIQSLRQQSERAGEIESGVPWVSTIPEAAGNKRAADSPAA